MISALLRPRDQFQLREKPLWGLMVYSCYMTPSSAAADVEEIGYMFAHRETLQGVNLCTVAQ